MLMTAEQSPRAFAFFDPNLRIEKNG